MAVFDPKLTGEKLQEILALIKSGDGEMAISGIADLVSQLRLLEDKPGARAEGPRESASAGTAPGPWRVIAAHLKAAEVQIQETHMSAAEESLAKAIYVALSGEDQAAEAQLNV